MPGFENFGDIKREIAHRLGHASVANAGSQAEAAIERAINQILRHLHALTENEFLRKQHLFRVNAEIKDLEPTSGEGVTATNGSTTVTVDSTVGITSSVVGMDVALNGGEELYAVTSFTSGGGGDDTVTIDPAYVGTSVTSNDGAYRFVQHHVTLPDECNTVLSVVNLDEDYHLKPIHTLEARRIVGRPLVTTDSTPTHWTVDGRLQIPDPSSTRVLPYRLAMFPTPLAQTTFQVDYYAIPTELESDTDIPDIPMDHRQTLLEGAWIQVATTWGNKSRESITISTQIYQSGVAAMLRRQHQKGNETRLGAYRGGKSYARDQDIPVVDVYQFDPNF